MFITLQIHSV